MWNLAIQLLKHFIKENTYLLIMLHRTRDYDFLKKKYMELLLPTILTVMSEKICQIADIFIIGIIIGVTDITVLQGVSPFIYLSGIFYVLFGQGGSLLAIRAKSKLDDEKGNFYYTISILGLIAVSVIFLAISIFFADSLLHMLNIPGEIFDLTKSYLYIISFFIPLNAYILTASFFVRTDGNAKIPFYAVLISNIFNIIFDIIFLAGFHMGIPGAAMASVLGYLIGSVYITKCLLKNHSYHFISIAGYKFKEIGSSFITIIKNTPEIVGKLFFASKILLYTFLCSTYYGSAGLLAFLIYDNSETLVYMFLSGIMKTMTPIVALFYKDTDYLAVEYTIKHSIMNLLIICIPISLIFIIYPEILIILFNVTDPQYIELVSIVIRITSIGLTFRCLSYLLTNYAQAIELNKLAAILLFLEEGLIPIAGGIVMTQLLGGMGIWYSIVLAEVVPFITYFIVFQYYRKNRKRIINHWFLEKSRLVHFTYYKTDHLRDEVVDKNNVILSSFTELFHDCSMIISLAIDDICHDIFNHQKEVGKDLDKIDFTLTLEGDDMVSLSLINGGDHYNPLLNQELMELDSMKDLDTLDPIYDYTIVLGFNKLYIKINRSNMKSYG